MGLVEQRVTAPFQSQLIQYTYRSLTRLLYICHKWKQCPQICRLSYNAATIATDHLRFATDQQPAFSDAALSFISGFFLGHPGCVAVVIHWWLWIADLGLFHFHMPFERHAFGGSLWFLHFTIMHEVLIVTNLCTFHFFPNLQVSICLLATCQNLNSKNELTERKTKDSLRMENSLLLTSALVQHRI